MTGRCAVTGCWRTARCCQSVGETCLHASRGPLGPRVGRRVALVLGACYDGSSPMRGHRINTAATAVRAAPSNPDRA
jgi:hypothetical protein